jgi:dephospho-CoA kinase
MAARGLSAGEADRMIAAQLPSRDKRARSQYVIDNTGDRADLERAAREVWQALLARA